MNSQAWLCGENRIPVHRYMYCRYTVVLEWLMSASSCALSARSWCWIMVTWHPTLSNKQTPRTGVFWWLHMWIIPWNQWLNRPVMFTASLWWQSVRLTQTTCQHQQLYRTIMGYASSSGNNFSYVIWYYLCKIMRVTIWRHISPIRLYCSPSLQRNTYLVKAVSVTITLGNKMQF